MPRDPEFDYCPECGAPVTSHEWDSESGVFVLCNDDRFTFGDEDTYDDDYEED